MAGQSSTRRAGRASRQPSRFTVRQGSKALLTTSSSVLLVQERHSDGTPFWTLPGGGVRPEESLMAGLRRELAEELDCQVRIEEPSAWFPYRHQGRSDIVSVYTVFDCLLASSITPNPAEGVLDCRWVAPANIPATTLPQVRYLCRQLADSD
jgi:ADP-ribose pyrophosphatase YjhB (NUDIX family)